MTHIRKLIYTTIVAALWILILGCSARKEVVQLEPTTQLPPEEKIASEPPPTPDELSEKALMEEKEMLIQEAWRMHDSAISYADESDWQMALFFAEQGMNLLEAASGPNKVDPAIREASRAISRDLDRFRILAHNNSRQKNLPQIELTHDPDAFLDELSDLDLYWAEIPPDLEGKVSEDLKTAVFTIPITVNKEVLQFLDYYQNRARTNTQQALDRSALYLDDIKKIFKEEGIPEELIYMAHVESLFKYNAYSRARARGMWQFMTGTARLYGLKVNWWVDERLDPMKSTRVAARYMKYLHEEFGDWYLVMAAYNVGPGRIQRILRRHGEMDYWTMMNRRLIPRETRNHVPATLAAIIIYNNPERYGFSLATAEPVPVEEFSVDYQVDLGVIAESIGYTMDDLRALNPALQRGVTPFEPKEYTLNIPEGCGAQLAQALEELPPSERIRLRHHRVSSGETLSLIASRYGVSIRAIADTNSIRNIHRLKIGQDLIIPVMEPRSIGPAEARKVLASSGTHTVRRGDSLYRISRLYGVKLQNLFEWNSLGPKSKIYPGQKIQVSPR